MKKLALMAVLFSSSAGAAPGSLSFNGSLEGTNQISSLILEIQSGGCVLFRSSDYGNVAMDANGTFSVNMDPSFGTFGASGAGYTSFKDIFDTQNFSIQGDGCTVDGTSASWGVTVQVNGINLAGQVPINAFPFALNAQSAVTTQKIAGTSVSTNPPSTGQVLQYDGISWVPATLSSGGGGGGGGVTAVNVISPLESTGGNAPTLSINGLNGYGGAHMLVGTNATNDALEYKNIATTGGLSISASTNTITIGAGTELGALSSLNTNGYLRRTGTGAYATTDKLDLLTEVDGVLPPEKGGTGSGMSISGQRLIVSAPNSMIEHMALAPYSVMKTDAIGLPTAGKVDLSLDVENVLPLTKGGTGTNNGSIMGTGNLEFKSGVGGHILLDSSLGGNGIRLFPGNGIVQMEGSLGINTLTPTERLHIFENGADASINLGVSGFSSSETAGINFLTYNGGSNYLSPTTYGFRLQAASNASFTPNKMSLLFWDGFTESTIYDMSLSEINFHKRMNAYLASPMVYTPLSSLSILDNSSQLTINNPSLVADSASLLRFRNMNNQQSAYIGTVSKGGGGSTPDIVIGQQINVSNYEERMRIDSTGKVGIATPYPRAKLHVDGSIVTGVHKTTCNANCDVIFDLSIANHFVVKFNGGTLNLSPTNSTQFQNYEGAEFSVTVCNQSGVSLSVPFSSVNGFVSGIAWTPVFGGSCSTQKFILLDTTGLVQAHPLAAQVIYSN